MAPSHAAWPDAGELSCLMESAQHGEVRAIDTLLATLRPPLLAFFARRLPLAPSEDLTQAALIRIAGALPRIAPDRADRYVRTVARNLLRTAYRSRARDARRTVPVELAMIIASSESVDRRAEQHELVLAVQRASMEVLPPPLREVVLALLEGQTPTEIATGLRINPVTVRTRLLRARVLLREELRPFLDGSPIQASRIGQFERRRQRRVSDR